MYVCISPFTMHAALSGDAPVKPTCHIFVKDKGNQEIMFPELPQHQEFP